METPEKRLGKYEILAEIGSGGFGTVYRARDTELDCEVALKVLRPERVRDAAFVQRFRREAQVAAKLDHPHIVNIYEVGEIEDRRYIAMRLLKGQSLSSLLLDRGGVLPPEVALPILEDVAEALDYAHAQGVIHRDVKPSNVIVTAEGSVLTDFGIAQLVSDNTTVTTTGQTVGTPEYMAPELIRDHEANAQTDIYALGVVAYEMLVGQLPFTGKTPFSVQEAHVHRLPPSACACNPSLPSTVDAVLEKALAKDPSQRYAEAREFVAELGAALGGVSVPSSRTISSGVISKPARQGKRRAKRVGVVALVAGIFITVLVTVALACPIIYLITKPGSNTVSAPLILARSGSLCRYASGETNSSETVRVHGGICEGFLTFDTRDIPSGATIVRAMLDLEDCDIAGLLDGGSPFSRRPMHIAVSRYGDLDPSDFGRVGDFPGPVVHKCSAVDVTEAFQSQNRDGYFQLRLYFDQDVWGWVIYHNPQLLVTYELSGR